MSITISRLLAFGLLAVGAVGLCGSKAMACACGCGIFDVGTSSMFPMGTGGMVYAEDDYMDQNRNWSGTSRSAATNNDDKAIRTSFFSVGGQYMFNRKEGIELQIPLADRSFRTDINGNVPDAVGADIQTFNHSVLGDIRISSIYSGFSPDMSSGVTYGVKLATGDSSYANFDSDTEIGTGSTDLLLGAYYMNMTNPSSSWTWFTNGLIDMPVLHKAGYRPGAEVDGAVGVYYNKGHFGSYKVAPMLELEGSIRNRDSLALADPADSGYQRVLLAPGLEVHSGDYRVDLSLGIPIYQDVNGDQLTAANLLKVNVSRTF